MNITKLTYIDPDFRRRINCLVTSILQINADPVKVYGIPRGGALVASLLREEIGMGCKLVFNPSKADVFVDDIVDSGATRDKYKDWHPQTPFLAMYNRDLAATHPCHHDGGWIQFPWEPDNDSEDIVIRMLERIGEDPKREGLGETPARVLRSWETIYGGYNEDPKKHIKVFESDCDEMVILRDCEYFSTCEHHMLPFFGKATIAYIPDGKVIGVSKLARVLDVFSRRLQIQERICRQVTDFLMDELQPKGAACILRGQHFCMTSRGVQKQSAIMVTSDTRGVFRENGPARFELLQLEK